MDRLGSHTRVRADWEGAVPTDLLLPLPMRDVPFSIVQPFVCGPAALMCLLVLPSSRVLSDVHVLKSCGYLNSGGYLKTMCMVSHAAGGDCGRAGGAGHRVLRLQAGDGASRAAQPGRHVLHELPSSGKQK